MLKKHIAWLVTSAALSGGTFCFAAPAVVQSSADAVNVQTEKSQETSQQALSELLFQFQQIQQEVMELRGQLEEALFQIEQLKQASRDRYIDLDRRLTEIQTGASSSAPASTPSSQDSPADSTVASSSDRQIEQSAFEGAKDLIRQKQYVRAVTAFEEFVVNYPNSENTPEAWYWMGELYLVIPDLDQARVAFLRMVNDYPGHIKHAEATYKLGLTYSKLGDKDNAAQYLNQVINSYPDSQTAKRARIALDGLN